MYGFASHPFASFATAGPSSSAHGHCKPTSASFSPFGYSSSPRYVYQDDSHATSSDSDSDDDLDSYYEYLDAARRAREHKKLEEAQARRHAQEQAYIRAKAQAEHEAKVRAAIEARQRYEAQQEKEYNRRRQHQAALEYRARQEAEYRARQEAEFRARKEAEYRAAMEAQARARAHAQAQAQAQQERKARQEEAQHIRRIQAAYQEDLLKHLFGSYLPRQHEQKASAPAARSSPVPEPSQAAPISAPQPQPQLERRPSVSSDHSSSSTMSREEAVTIIQTLAKQQINLRRRIGTVKSIRSRFETLKSEYQQPESYVAHISKAHPVCHDLTTCISSRLIFNAEKSTASAPVLAYTPVNRPLQAYEEALTRLLTQLDEISSQGSDKVKKERKALATDVQKELDRLDGIKVVEWARQSVQQREETIDSPAIDVAETTAAHAAEETSTATEASDAAMAFEPVSAEAALATEAAAQPTSSDEDTMQVDATEENSASQEQPTAKPQPEPSQMAASTPIPAVETGDAQFDVDSESTVTEPLISDAAEPDPAVAQGADVQLESDSDVVTQEAGTVEDLEHAISGEGSLEETHPHPSTSSSPASNEHASTSLPAAEDISIAEEPSEKHTVHPLSIPGLISQIVRESYEEMEEDEKRTAEEDTRSESSGSESSFEML